MPRHPRVWLLCLLLAAPWSAAQGPATASADGLLQQMTHALRTLDYQGSLVYEHDGRIDSLRLFHAGGEHERERLVSLSGPTTEIVRDGGKVVCNLADGSSAHFTQSSTRGLLPLVPTASRRALSSHYAISLAGTDRVAGHSADIVDVAARDGYRYGYRLWLDRQTRLLLRSVVLDGKKRPLEQVMFVALEIGVPPDETDLRLARAPAPATRAAPVETESPSSTRWQVVDLPEGFRLVSTRQATINTDGAEHHVYSDGLAGVSVYIEPLTPQSGDSSALSMRGTLNIYTQAQGSWRVTAMGNVPALTVQQMAQSVTPLPASDTTERVR